VVYFDGCNYFGCGVCKQEENGSLYADVLHAAAVSPEMIKSRNSMEGGHWWIAKCFSVAKKIHTVNNLCIVLYYY